METERTRVDPLFIDDLFNGAEERPKCSPTPDIDVAEQLRGGLESEEDCIRYEHPLPFPQTAVDVEHVDGVRGIRVRVSASAEDGIRLKEPACRWVVQAHPHRDEP